MIVAGKYMIHRLFQSGSIALLIGFAIALQGNLELNSQTNPASSNPSTRNPSEQPSEKPTVQTLKDSAPKDPIAEVLAAKLMQNFPDGKFYPERGLSRAEIATILVKTFSSDRVRSLKTNREFVDVSKNYWAYQAIKTAVAAEVMIGYEKDRFFPNQKITRAEGFATFANAYGIFQFPEEMVVTALAPYSDSKELPIWARKAWATALNEEFVNTDQSGKINSLKPMTRMDMAYALSKFLEKEKGRSGIQQ
jgi:S-layer homology domain